MLYIRIHRTAHLSTDAGIVTLCGLTIASLRAEVEISAERPQARLCPSCRNRHFAERRQTTQIAQEEE